MKNQKVFLLTLNWDGEDKLKKLAPSLIPSLTDINYEWFIKDNNSKDKSIDYIKSLENDKINIIPYKNNLQNFSAGMNFLFNEAKPNDDDLILLLNNDVIFNDTESIKNMIDIIQNNNVGVVGARLLYTNTNKLQHAGVVFHKIAQAPMHFRLNEVSDKNSEHNREFQVVTGAVLLTKAKYFKNVCLDNKSGQKGMNENYNWSFEDVDLCLAIKYNMNKKIIYCGKTNIFHEESASLKRNPVNKMFMNHNMTFLKNKWLKRYVLDQDIYIKDNKYNLYKE